MYPAGLEKDNGQLLHRHIRDSHFHREDQEDDAMSIFAPSEASFLYDEIDKLDEERYVQIGGLVFLCLNNSSTYL